MRTKKLSQLLCLLLAFCLTAALGACSRAPAIPVAGGSAPAGLSGGGETEQVLRTEKLYPLEAGADVTSLVRQGQTLLIAGEAEGKPLLALADYTLGESDAVTLFPARPLALDAPEDPAESRIAALCAAPDGDFYVLTGERPARWLDPKTYEELENPDYAGRYAVLHYGTDGTLKEHLAVHWPHDDAVSLTVVESGALVVCGDANIAVLDRGGQLLYDQELPEHTYAMSACAAEQGVIVSLFDGLNFGTHYSLINPDSGALSELPVDEDSVIDVGGRTACQGLRGECLVNSNGSFYEYDPVTGVHTLLMTWLQAMFAEEPASCCRLAENCFITGGDAGEALTVYRYDHIPVGTRQTLRVACVGEYGDGGLINRFNNESTEYRCELETYSQDQANALLTAIAAGDCPDLVLFSGQFNTASRAFDDLYPYLDADPELSRESFLPNLLPALETGGELHELWPGVVLYTLYARGGDVGDGVGLTTEDYARLLAGSEKRSLLFEPFMTQTNLLSWLAATCTAEFIDRENGACRFDDPGFVELLEWCADMGQDYEGEVYTGPEYTSDDVLLFFEAMQSPLRVHYIRQAFPDAVFVGFPGGEGSGSYYDNVGIRMAIPAASRNKEGAWAFIRSQFTTERQMEDKMGGMAVTLEALHRTAAELSQEELQLLDDLLSRTTKAVMNGDETLRSIISDGGMAFLNGDKTAGEAAALIQSRASIYLAEQFG